MVDEIPSEGSGWNEAQLKFARMHRIMAGAHEARMVKQYSELYICLEALYMELESWIGETESNEMLKEMKVLAMIANDMESGVTYEEMEEVHERFLMFELALRRVMRKQKMDMPEGDDEFDI